MTKVSIFLQSQSKLCFFSGRIVLFFLLGYNPSSYKYLKNHLHLAFCMSIPHSASAVMPSNPFSLEQAFKQFSLETERLEMTYQSLQERFKSVQSTLQESHTRLAGKLSELDFVSRYLDAILNHISQGIIFIDLNGIVTTYNAAAQQILQVPEKDFLLHPFNVFFDDSFLGFSLKKAFATKQCPEISFLSWDQKGHLMELEVEATFVAMSPEAYPLDHRQARATPIQGMLVLLRDISKLRRLQQIADRHDRLKELGELAAHLAHEIRNPLGGIKGFATLLQQDLHDRPDLQQMASYIVQGADDLNQFVSQVLQYARPFQIHLENVDLINLIEEIRQLLQADPAWNGNITFTVQSSLPALLIPIDPQLLKSALLNLFVNAIQAMPSGGSLKVKLESEISWVTICIEDTGIGITPENLSKIFSPFFTTKETGNGLGLAEVHKAIQAHQGWIEVQSEVGRGTTFIIKIPLKSDSSL
jgi:signal transduction histidine kinase